MATGETGKRKQTQAKSSSAPKRTDAKKILKNASPSPPDEPKASAGEESATAAHKGFASAADEVDEQLERYRGMRDFAVTAEPSGTGKQATHAAAARTSQKRTKAAGGLPFVIQKHAASHLHYDFRLGWNGVLKSWAVAKGPSYYPGDRRLAVQVEDHPMEYGGFEGIIPTGQYGGGTVMVWDQGTWWPQLGHENVDAGLREGGLKFEMHGTKLEGKWTLVRMGGKVANERKPNWLLIKEHDAFERPQTAVPITEEAPNSAVTGRSLEQIAEQEDHVWNSNRTANGDAWTRQNPKETLDSKAIQDPKEISDRQAAAPRTPSRRKNGSAPGQNVQGFKSALPSLENYPRETQPAFLPPQLAEEAENPPEGSEWLHELKLDGYRIQARKRGREVQLLTRSGLDWTHRMPEVAEAVARLRAADATLDGEVVVLAADGTTNFADLQASFQQGADNPLTYFCFDLLHLNGHSLRGASLRERKSLLAALAPEGDPVLRLSEHLETSGAAIFQKACDLHAEGIVSKRASAAYQGGRSRAWLKSKCLREQEFVVGGFTFSSDGEDRIGSLLLGYYSDGKLIYAGRTGTGFTQRSRKDLRRSLEAIRSEKAAFSSVPAPARRGVVWVQPRLVAQVRFATWTAEDLVRQAAFLGLREDKQASEVRREEPTVAPRPKDHTARKKPAGQARSVSKPPRRHAQVRSTSGSVAAKTAAAAVLEGPQGQSTAAAKPKLPPVRLTHPDKIIDPESELTKAELARYYWAVADRMLPHIAGRPLSLVRCPEGADKPCFFQKHVNHMLPQGIGSIDVPNKKTGVPEPYITLDTTEALVGLAQMGVLEVHPWGSRNENLEHPDRLIFDLDPDESLPWSTLCKAAGEVRSRLKKAGLSSFLKLTGGKGLHIVAPVKPELDWPQFKDLAHRFVDAMARANPALYLTKMTKSERKGRIYLDYLRNERGATAVAPYSPRARRGVHVSLPLPWSALKLEQRPVFSVHDFPSWEKQLKADPWKAILSTSQRIDPGLFTAL